jgi:hypothetical protein
MHIPPHGLLLLLLLPQGLLAEERGQQQAALDR